MTTEHYFTFVKKGLEGHVVLSSVFSVKVKGLGRFEHIMQVNAWLSGWYCRQMFSFYYPL